MVGAVVNPETAQIPGFFLLSFATSFMSNGAEERSARGQGNFTSPSRAGLGAVVLGMHRSGHTSPLRVRTSE